MKVAVEDNHTENIFTTTSSSQKTPPDQQQRYPSWQRGPLLLSEAAAGDRRYDDDHYHHHYHHHQQQQQQQHPRHSSQKFVNIAAPVMPALLTCREDNMSKLAIYSSDDDSDLDGIGKDERGGGATARHEDQPSTGRTEAVSEFSNLAGMSAATVASAFPLKRTAMAGDNGGGRALELVPSYSTTGYAGWSKFCLATSDGEQEDENDSDSSEPRKEVSSTQLIDVFVARCVHAIRLGACAL